MFRETHVDSVFSSRYKIVRDRLPIFRAKIRFESTAFKIIFIMIELERRGTDCSASFVGKETKWQTLEWDVCHKKSYVK